MTKQRSNQSAVELSQEQEELAQRIYERLRMNMDEELLAMARLMAAKEPHEIFGNGEFALRDKWQRDEEGRGCAYVSLDHVSVPQQGPQGGKAEGRMAAVAMIYNPPSEHDEPHPRGDCQVRILSGLYELDQLGLALRRQAARVGWDTAEQQLALSDAGNGLEDFAAQNFPLAQPILDFYHASEHVATLAAAAHPDDAAAATAQTTDWCHRLKHEGGPALLAVWEQLDVRRWSPQPRKAHRQQLQYFRNYQLRMDHSRYLARGWQFRSGPVESGCKRLVIQRP